MHAEPHREGSEPLADTGEADAVAAARGRWRIVVVAGPVLAVASVTGALLGLESSVAVRLVAIVLGFVAIVIAGLAVWRLPGWRSTIAAVIVAVVSALSLPFACLHTWQYVVTHRESRQILRNVETAEEAAAAVNSRGIFLRYPDGHWLAIRYADRHVPWGWSSAVARDSRGRLYSSNAHFCGRFESYRRLIEDEQLNAEAHLRAADGRAFSGDEQMHALAIAETLADAVDRLIDLGFEPW